MNAIPAIVAGVKRIVMINPGFKGNQNPAVLYAARKCKIKEIYSIGGPSAIAAVSYGTKKIKKVDKIVGPGNSYVAAAKKEVFGEVGIGEDINEGTPIGSGSSFDYLRFGITKTFFNSFRVNLNYRSKMKSDDRDLNWIVINTKYKF